MKRLLPILLILQIACLASFAQGKFRTKQEVMYWLGEQLRSHLLGTASGATYNAETISFNGFTLHFTRITRVKSTPDVIELQGQDLLCRANECYVAWTIRDKRDFNFSAESELYQKMVEAFQLLVSYNKNMKSYPEKVFANRELTQPSSLEDGADIETSDSSDNSKKTYYGGTVTVRALEYYEGLSVRREPYSRNVAATIPCTEFTRERAESALFSKLDSDVDSFNIRNKNKKMITIDVNTLSYEISSCEKTEQQRDDEEAALYEKQEKAEKTEQRKRMIESAGELIQTIINKGKKKP